MLLQWRNKHNARYYTVSLQQDLFGGWALSLFWGKEGVRSKRVAHQPVDSEKDGLLAIRRISERREAHGYELVDVSFLPAISKTTARP